MAHEFASKSMIEFLLRLTFALAGLLATVSVGCGAQRASGSLRLPQRATEWQQTFECNLSGKNESRTGSLTSGPHWPRALGKLRAPHASWWQRIWFNIMHECNREPSAWRYLYIDEMLEAFEPRVLDRSADERLANILYSINLNNLVDSSYLKFDSGDRKRDLENEQRVAGPEVSEEQCEADLAEMGGQMEELRARVEALRAGQRGAHFEARHLRLVRVLDSFGRYESGMLTGQTKLMGAYGQCESTALERRAPDATAPNKQLAMRYCWAKLSFEGQLSEQLRRRPRLQHETAETDLAVAVCLPRSCHTKTLHKHRPTVQRFIDSQFQLPSTSYVNQSGQLESLFCLVDADSQFRMPLSGRLFFVFAACWLAACCAATHFELGARQPAEPTKVALEAIKLARASCLTGSLSVCSRQARSPANKRRPTLLRCLSHFDLRKSWNDFATDKRLLSSTARVELDVLNPVKIFASLFCVAAHSALLLATVSGHQGQIAAFVERDYIIQAALVASVVVDTFFVISALLLTYITLKKLSGGFGFGTRPQTTSHIESAPQTAAQSAGQTATQTSAQSAAQDQSKQDSSLTTPPNSCTPVKLSSWLVSPTDLANFLANWFVLALARYLRLVPLYALMFWFRRDVLTYLGSGPLWDFGLNRNTMNGACSQESSLTPFTFLSAFVPLNKQCYVPSWSISNDILFSLLAPPVVLLLRKRAKLATYVILALIGATAANSVRGYTEAEPQNRWELGEYRLHGIILFFNALSHLYSSPLYRSSAYLIGMLAGQALFNYDQNTHAHKHTRWPGWLTRLATPLAALYLLAHTIISVQAMELKSLIYPYHRLGVAFFVTLDRPLWAAANAILFLRMLTDWRLNKLMRVWAHQAFRSLARLNYATIFTHWIFIVVQNNILVALPAFTAWQIYSQVASIYLAALPTALFIHIVFENPLDNLIKRELFKM